MKSFLNNLTQKQIDEIVEEHIRKGLKKRFEKSGKNPFPNANESDVKAGATRDVWNIYRYGDFYKVVYIKTLERAKTRERGNISNVNGISADTAEEKIEIADKFKKTKKAAEKETQQRFSQSISRTRARIFELAACNEFTHFCTFTQDKEKRDRFDLADFRKDFAQLVRNLNRNRAEDSKIKYILIPERHKNGAWHMHGFLKGLSDKDLRPFTLEEKLPQRLRKQLKKGEKIYDWTRYRRAFGYFTCTEIKNGIAAAKYITKYVTKNVAKTARENGAHLFFASQGLRGREVVEWRNLDECPIEKWDFENDFVKVKEFQIDSATGEIKEK